MEKWNNRAILQADCEDCEDTKSNGCVPGPARNALATTSTYVSSVALVQKIDYPPPLLPLSGKMIPCSAIPSSTVPFVAGSPVVDLRRYPIQDLESSEGAALLARVRSEYVSSGATLLPGFLTHEAMQVMATEARQSVPLAHFSTTGHNVFMDAGDCALPPDAPRNRCVRTVVGSIAYDHLPRGSVLAALYNWPPLTEFVRRVLGEPELHLNADPIGACSINVCRPGDEQGWHFDETEFSVTLMLSEPDEGGEFEFVKDLRSDPAISDRLGALLDGGSDSGRRKQLPIAQGTLSLFGGRTALHRVAPIKGKATRLVAVLAYNKSPGVTNSESVRELFWGRKQAVSGAGSASAA